MNSTSTPSPQASREGPVARAIERQTSKVPSDLFLWAAGAAIAGSAILQLTQPRRMSLFNVPTRSGQLASFVGQWAPTILILGLYNKMVKVAGSDRTSL